MSNRNEQMINTREACKHLLVSEATMRRFLSRAPVNHIPAYKVGYQYRFYRSELTEWVKEFRSGGRERTEAVDTDSAYLIEVTGDMGTEAGKEIN